MSDRCAFDGKQTFTGKTVVQVMGLLKYCLEGIIKDLLVFLAPNIIVIMVSWKKYWTPLARHPISFSS